MVYFVAELGINRAAQEELKNCQKQETLSDNVSSRFGKAPNVTKHTAHF
jgi:hypothetical protein